MRGSLVARRAPVRRRDVATGRDRDGGPLWGTERARRAAAASARRSDRRNGSKGVETPHELDGTQYPSWTIGFEPSKPDGNPRRGRGSRREAAPDGCLGPEHSGGQNRLATPTISSGSPAPGVGDHARGPSAAGGAPRRRRCGWTRVAAASVGCADGARRRLLRDPRHAVRDLPRSARVARRLRDGRRGFAAWHVDCQGPANAADLPSPRRLPCRSA
jgi:hypothetical protein